MKLFSWLVIIFSFRFNSSDGKNQLVSEAIKSVLKNYFIDNSSKIEIIQYGYSRSSEKLVLGIIREKPSSIIISVSKNEFENPRRQLTISSLLIFDSVETFKTQVKHIRWLSNSKVRFKHLVYIPRVTVNDLIENIEDGFAIDCVNFLMNETSESIELVTSFMFTSETCKKNQLVTINRFSSKTSKWENEKFYVEKYRNLYDCELVVGRTKVNSVSIRLYEELQEILHFEIRWISFKSTNELVSCRECDLITQPVGALDKKLITSVPFDVHSLTYIVPNGEPYELLTRMFMMFDSQLWYSIAGTLVVGLVFIRVISFMSTNIQDRIFGTNMRRPTLNLFEVFLCGSQYRFPRTHCARFILMMFMIWSLIIRTCYQSKLFEYLQADLRKPSASTIGEVEEKFTVYGHNVSKEHFTRFEDLNLINFLSLNFFLKISRDTKFKECANSTKTFKCLEAVAVGSNNFAIQGYETYLNNINSGYRTGVSSLRLIKENIGETFLSIGFFPYSPYYEVINEKIHELISTGFFLRWYTNIIKVKIGSEENIGPQVLSMDHLQLCFLACVIAISASILMFACEILALKISKMARTLCINIFWIYVLHIFMRARTRSV